MEILRCAPPETVNVCSISGSSDLKDGWMLVHVLKNERHGEQELNALFPLEGKNKMMMMTAKQFSWAKLSLSRIPLSYIIFFTCYVSQLRGKLAALRNALSVVDH